MAHQVAVVTRDVGVGLAALVRMVCPVSQGYPDQGDKREGGVERERGEIRVPQMWRDLQEGRGDLDLRVILEIGHLMGNKDDRARPVIEERVEPREKVGVVIVCWRSLEAVTVILMSTLCTAKHQGCPRVRMASRHSGRDTVCWDTPVER